MYPAASHELPVSLMDQRSCMRQVMTSRRVGFNMTSLFDVFEGLKIEPGIKQT